jgi:hypothetical protein
VRRGAGGAGPRGARAGGAAATARAGGGGGAGERRVRGREAGGGGLTGGPRRRRGERPPAAPAAAAPPAAPPAAGRAQARCRPSSQRPAGGGAPRRGRGARAAPVPLPPLPPLPSPPLPPRGHHRAARRNIMWSGAAIPSRSVAVTPSGARARALRALRTMITPARAKNARRSLVFGARPLWWYHRRDDAPGPPTAGPCCRARRPDCLVRPRAHDPAQARIASAREPGLSYIQR